MKISCDLILVVPVGPQCKPEYIIDTLESFAYYCGCIYEIILADDSGKGTGRAVRKQIPSVTVVQTSEPMGKGAGLYLTLCLAYRYALRNYSFQAILRMDTDALVIGPQPEGAALDMFRNFPSIGIAGQYPLDYHGKPWDLSYPKQQLLYYTSTRHLRHKTFPRMLLWLIYRSARRNGYLTGESVFGGAYFISRPFLIALKRRGLLPLYPLKKIELEEDHIFSLLAKALGFQLGDLSSGAGPMGCEWKGLPASPEILRKTGKKIIHSVRQWEGLDETKLRSFFRNRR